MPRPNYPPEFQSQVRQAMATPEPDAERMKAQRQAFIDRGVAAFQPGGQIEPADRPLGVSNPAERRRSGRISARLAWMLALLALVLLFTLVFSAPQVVKALRRLLGYLPGVGLIDASQSTTETALKLERPVTIERDGVTLTVEFAVALAEKTTVLYRHVEPPVDANSFQLPEIYVEDRPRLILPDGRALDALTGRHQPSGGEGISFALDFPPLPAGVEQVTLELTRLAGLGPGEAPENWQIPLQFTPVDLAQIVLPVIDYEATPGVRPAAGNPTPVSSPSEAPTAGTRPAEEGTAEAAVAATAPAVTPPYGLAITLEKSVELDAGYLLMGRSEWTDATILPNQLGIYLLAIRDANGGEIAYEYAPLEAFPQPGERRQNWAFLIATKEFAAPLALEFSVLLLEAADTTFPLDVGPNPQNGQSVDLNLDLVVNGRPLKVISATYYNPIPEIHNFDFLLSSEADIVGVKMYEAGHPPAGGGGGGGGVPQLGAPFATGLSVEGELPSGALTVVIYGVEVFVPGDWTIVWAP